MDRTIVGALLALGLAASTACDRQAPGYGRQLAGSEIDELFAGKTVTGHHELHGYDFKSYYDPNGTYRSHQSDKSAPRSAKWWVRGDDICVRWDDTPGDLCRRMFMDGQGVYRKVDVDGGRVVVTFQSFERGNPQNL